MKTSIFYIVFFSLSLLACSDFLEIEPDVQVSIEEQLSTKAGVLEAYSGIYKDIETLTSSNYALYGEVLGGNIAFTPASSTGQVSVFSQIETTYNFEATQFTVDFESYYLACYEIINQSNLLLERSDGFTFFDSEGLNQLKAELLTIRAFAHYQVSLLFAQNYNFTPNASHLGVVYNTETLTAGEDFPARKTMAETYSLIKTDLNDALNLHGNTQLLSGPSFSYFNVLTTKALYARVALQMNDWDTARSFADDIIDNSGIALMSSETYVQEWEQEVAPVSEVILEFTAPRNSDGSVSSSVSEFFSSNQNSNIAKNSASGDLIDLYTDDDIRRSMFIQQDINTNVNGVITPKTYYFTKKFQNDAGTTVIRLSELYLIRAEANARLGSLEQALNDLNTVRTRANLEAITNTSNLLQEIFIERRLELAFENMLFFDILRYKKDVFRDQDCISNLCDVAYPSPFFIQPIPFFSISLNQNIQQNEGY
ncbi:RagB/SusD family nutrient uptake outer membrane protein [Subsaximicrobium wynnwilliamsii]|nr:RagB/SusD family nutrient uptake outer membrane protein [Subsaximicrobium wynnwilliamsii]